jgi:hypothetical protein
MLKDLNQVAANQSIIIITTLLALMCSAKADAYHPPHCQCELSVYKRKRSPLPYIVGVLRDSASQKPLPFVGALLVNNVVSRSDKDGKTYLEVISNKIYKIIAKVYFHQPCIRNLCLSEGDSVVCTFSMRRNREPSDRPSDFFHKRRIRLIK